MTYPEPTPEELKAYKDIYRGPAVKAVDRFIAKRISQDNRDFRDKTMFGFGILIGAFIVGACWLVTALG
jgi:hypothetical protein